MKRVFRNILTQLFIWSNFLLFDGTAFLGTVFEKIFLKLEEEMGFFCTSILIYLGFYSISVVPDTFVLQMSEKERLD